MNRSVDSKKIVPLGKIVDKDFLQEELEKRFKCIADGDTLAQMELLREFKKEWHSHIARQESQILDREIISLALNALSEVILNKVCDVSMNDTIDSYQFSDIKEEIIKKIPFAILAYGNLGAKELHYTSDLDLVFLYDTATEMISLSKNREISSCEFTTRLAQRIIYFLSTPLVSGILFQVDVRLRPDGNAGLLVSSFLAFKKYLHGNAWDWEHRALVKARVVVGSDDFHKQFELLRKEILESPMDKYILQDQIIAMRKRIRKKYRQQSNLDLKTMEGGVTDIDFVVQYAILRYIRIYPDLVNERSSLKILYKLKDYQLLGKQIVQTLISAYEYYQSLARKQYVQSDLHIESIPTVKKYQEQVKAIWLQCIMY